jgi:opacity protein-like surface antigen
MFHKRLLVLVVVTLTTLSSVIAAAYMASIILQPVAAQNKTVATSTAATNTSTTPPPTTDYRVYDNSTLGIKIDVPYDWLYKEINNTAVSFVTPNASSTSRAAVVVLVASIPRNTHLDVFTQGSINNLQQGNPSFHLITSNTTTLASNPTHQIVFTSPSSTGKELNKGTEIWTLKNGKAYIIVYRAGPGVDKFLSHLPVIKHMIDSFQITK